MTFSVVYWMKRHMCFGFTNASVNWQPVARVDKPWRRQPQVEPEAPGLQKFLHNLVGKGESTVLFSFFFFFLL